VKGISRFVGINFYHKFIPHLADVAAPLNALRKNGVKFVWGKEQQTAIDKLKEAISQPPVLRMADFSKPFVLQTDASGVALGAVLSQDVDGFRQPIAYASRTLSVQDRKASSIYELECLAVLFGMDKFRPYLEHTEFLLETDNQALSWLLSNPRQLGKIGRWVVKISSLKFKVQHVRGTQNVVADALSRMFDASPHEAVSAPCHTLLTTFPLAFCDLAKLPREDPKLLPVLEKLDRKEPDPKFSLVKGVLHCRSRCDRKRKVVVPMATVPMLFDYFPSWRTFGSLQDYPEDPRKFYLEGHG
jgi:hypothetical protein